MNNVVRSPRTQAQIDTWHELFESLNTDARFRKMVKKIRNGVMKAKQRRLDRCDVILFGIPVEKLTAAQRKKLEDQTRQAVDYVRDHSKDLFRIKDDCSDEAGVFKPAAIVTGIPVKSTVTRGR